MRKAAPPWYNGAVSLVDEPSADPAPGLAPDVRRRRVMVVVNPHATTVSDRLRSLVVHALSARYEIAAVDTQRQGHAIELARAAAAGGLRRGRRPRRRRDRQRGGQRPHGLRRRAARAARRRDERLREGRRHPRRPRRRDRARPRAGRRLARAARRRGARQRPGLPLLGRGRARRRRRAPLRRAPEGQGALQAVLLRRGRGGDLRAGVPRAPTAPGDRGRRAPDPGRDLRRPERRGLHVLQRQAAPRRRGRDPRRRPARRRGPAARDAARRPRASP